MIEDVIELMARTIYEHWANYPRCRTSESWEWICEKKPPMAEDFRRKARAVHEALQKVGHL